MLKLGEILFKYRDYTPLPFMVVMVVSPAATSCSLLVGGILMLLGEAIRVHGVAYIGGVSRTRSYSTGQKVISGGPFARVRNPLYLGNLLLSAGLVAGGNISFFFPQGFLVLFLVSSFLGKKYINQNTNSYSTYSYTNSVAPYSSLSTTANGCVDRARCALGNLDRTVSEPRIP